MNSISFTNPYLLFVGIALLAVVLVPFFLSIKKIGFNFHNITSLVIHGVLAVLVTLALAGMTLTLVMTETDVYVLADCSYSSIKNLDTVDTYIKDLNKNLPDNSKLGIICYGKDYEVLTNLGEKLKVYQKIILMIPKLILDLLLNIQQHCLMMMRLKESLLSQMVVKPIKRVFQVL